MATLGAANLHKLSSKLNLKAESNKTKISTEGGDAVRRQPRSAGKKISETVELSQELISRGFAEVKKSMQPASARGAAIAVAKDFYENISAVGLLASTAAPKKGTADVALELSSIRRDTIKMMNRIPAEINIQVADEIKDLIARNEWPTDRETINARIHEISRRISESR